MLSYHQAPQSFPILPSTAKTFVFIAVVLAFCMAPLVVMMDLFDEPPIVALVGFVVLCTASVICYVGWSSRHVRFELSSGGLRIHNSLFGRKIPRADLLPEQGRVVSIPEHPELKPILRTFGSGLVGYCEGWFRLRNWQKALLFLTDRTRVVDLPTRGGYRILLSVADPERFLQAAHDIWGIPEPTPETPKTPKAAGKAPTGIYGTLEPR
jgi:hypothetical protein